MRPINAKFNLVLSDSLLGQIEQIAEQEGITKSAFVRSLIVERFESDMRQEIAELKERVAKLEEEVAKLKNLG